MRTEYLMREGIKSLWHNKMMTLASVAVLSACLMLIGVAGLLSVNLNSVMQYIEDQNEVEIFVLDTATEEQQAAIANLVEKDTNVSSYKFISKEDALKEVYKEFGESNPLLDGMAERNPFPASYRIQLIDLEKLDETVSHYNGVEGVEKINAPTAVADTLLSVSNLITVVCLIFVAILVAVSLLIISNTIRLTVFNRRREINIMKYVGATNWFIRIPFLVEGIAIGLIAALVAFGCVYGGYSAMLNLIGDTTSGFIASASTSIIPFSKLWYYVLGGFALGGTVTGAFGSLTSMQKHLEV